MGGTNADQAVAEAILETSLDAIAPITLIYNEKDDAKKVWPSVCHKSMHCTQSTAVTTAKLFIQLCKMSQLLNIKKVYISNS